MQIPVTDNGSLLAYPWYNTQMIESEDFVDELEFDGFYRGRSAAGATWRSVTTDRRYPMFNTCLDEVIKNCTISGGRVTAEWTFCKRGANYSLKLKSNV